MSRILQPYPRTYLWSAYGLIAIVTLAAHGWALDDGLFLDDHWHRHQLARSGWSLSDTIETSTIQPDRFIHLWWQEQPVEWRYVRPVSIWLMKAVFEVSNGDPLVQHAVSLALHTLCAFAVFSLILTLTRHWTWSLLGSLLFVLYSHSVYAVAWIAAQNAVLQTTLCVAALLTYLRASGLDSTSNLQSNPRLNPPLGAGMGPVRRGWFALTAGLLLLALLSRENAIVLPIFLMAVDYAFGGKTLVWNRRWAHFALVGIVVAYAAWRFVWIAHPLPDVYFQRPFDGYVLWCIAKLMHYLTSAIWLSPMTIGPTGRYAPFSEVPGDCLLMGMILLVIGGGYAFACRRIRGWWIWPLWIVLSVLPVTPILATPHSGYMPGVGFAVAMVWAPARRPLRDEEDSVSIDESGPKSGLPLKFLIRRPSISAVVAIWFLIATTVYAPIYRTMWDGICAAERCSTTQITLAPPETDVTDVFYINLPFVSIYTPIILENRLGDPASSARHHVLTFAPEVLEMNQPCTVDVIDDHRLAVSVQGRPYFSGLLGRFLIDAMRTHGRLQENQQFDAGEFTVRIDRADADGVTHFEFEFDRPIYDPHYAFYVSSRDAGAAPLRYHPSAAPSLAEEPSECSDSLLALAWERVSHGDHAAAVVLFSCATTDAPSNPILTQSFLPLIRRLAAATESPIRALAETAAPGPQSWSALSRWWIGYVDDDVLRAIWCHRDELDRLYHTRDGLERVRSRAAKMIRTDLYLTGPPFPGPR